MKRVEYPLMLVEYHNGEGAATFAVGWDAGVEQDDQGVWNRVLYTTLEKRTETDWVPGPEVRIPVDWIFEEKLIKTSMPKHMRQ